MLRKVLLVAKRDYIASVRTKAFIFGLIIAPLLFGSGFFALAIMKNKPDLKERRIAIVDHTGAAAGEVVESIRRANREDMYDKLTGRQVMPLYTTEIVSPAQNAASQRLELSNRIRRGDLYGFLEIGPSAIDSAKTPASDREPAIAWYSNESSPGPRWISTPVEDGIRRARFTALGVDRSGLDQAMRSAAPQRMNLVTRDEKTGHIIAGGKTNELAGFFVPFALAFLLFMIVMSTSAPMLPAIAEDKMQRVFEMLLASATPFQLIAGKILSAVARSLTSSIIYVGIALVVLNGLAMIGLAPIGLLPWFIIYVIAEVTMLSAIASAIGAACGSPQDAQSLGIVLFAPVIIPMMMLQPVLQRPNSSFAVLLSLFPPFTPLVMMARQATPQGLPFWQPFAGLVGIAVGTAAICWLAARIFRITILMQGKPPAIAELIRWGIKG
jgi:ABC-2 type transport system permease protein